MTAIDIANPGVNDTALRAALSLLVGIVKPGGRLTLVSGTPVMNSDQTAKTAIYYTQFVTDFIPIYTSSGWAVYRFSELTLNLDTTNHASGSLYDVFVWNNSGTLAIGTGPAWSSTTARGTGAGTTELQKLNGIWTNKNSITLKNGAGSGTSGIAANTATYVGTFYATANGQTGMAYQPTAAAGGTNNILGLYNAYNRLSTTARCQDSTSSWTYGTTTWRAANNSSSNRITFVDGLQESPVKASYKNGSGSAGTSNYICFGLNLDSTSANPTSAAQAGGTAAIVPINIYDSYLPQLGLHYVQAMEAGGNGTSTIYANEIGPTRTYFRLELTMDM